MTPTPFQEVGVVVGAADAPSQPKESAMNEMATAAVEKGAALLTTHFGDTSWVGDIDLGTLYVASDDQCPLGQLFGDFITGRDTLGIGVHGATAYGFDAFDSDYGYSDLDGAWIEFLAR